MKRLVLKLAVIITAAFTLSGCDKLTYLEAYFLRYTWPWDQFIAWLAMAVFSVLIFSLITWKRKERRDVRRAVYSVFLAGLIVEIFALAQLPLGWSTFLASIPALVIIGRREYKAGFPGLPWGKPHIKKDKKEKEKGKTKPKPKPPVEPSDDDEVPCPHCKTANPSGYKFCQKCGHPPEAPEASTPSEHPPKQKKRKHRVL